MEKDAPRTVKGHTLIVQSGGIKSTPNGNATRAKFLKDDYFLDNIQFKSLISGTATGGAHNDYELNFNIMEPNDITFLPLLEKEIEAFNMDTGDGNLNPQNQNYLMVIRFYGYDYAGNLMKKFPESEETTDEKAVVEKFIPFTFKNISFKLETDQVVYRCEAIPSAAHVGFDKRHGQLISPISPQGKTLKSLFTGKNGMVDQLNEHEKVRVGLGHVKEANVYDVEFQDGSELEGSTLQAQGSTFHAVTGWPKDQTAASQLTKQQKIDKTTRVMHASAGMKISKFIDMAIRSSIYITSQNAELIEPNSTTASQASEDNKDKDVTKSFKWFKISVRLEYLKYDSCRNDYAKKITYVISEFVVPSLDRSHEKDTGIIPEVVKEYDWWFTGKNTEVLDFSQNFDYLYYNSFSSSGSKKKETTCKGNGPLVTRNPDNKSSESSGENSINIQSGFSAEELYSPGDQATASMRIIGDPDWITQNEIFYGSHKDSEKGLIMPDGSINSNSAEIYFSIKYNKVVDYDIVAGTADTTKNNKDNDPQYKFIYRANVIDSFLKEGEFYQIIEGTLHPVPPGAKPEEK